MTVRLKAIHVCGRTSGLLALLIIAAGSLATPAHAAVLTKVSSGDWFNVVNWSPRLVPTLADDALVDSAADIAGSVAAARNVLLDSIINIGDEGGLAVDFFVRIGDSLDGGGTINIDAENALLSVRRQLMIGNAGSGTLEVDAGTVSVDDALFVGGGAFNLEVAQELQARLAEDPDYEPPTVSGRMTIRGPDSKVFANAMSVGAPAGFGSQFQTSLHATGSVQVAEGGQLSTGFGTPPPSTTGIVSRFGTVTVEDTGSLWSSKDDIRIEGGLTVRNGGKVDFFNAFSDLWVRRNNSDTGYTGTLEVDGFGSVITDVNELLLEGQMTIDNGGALYSQQGTIRAGGSATVRGAGSFWRIENRLDLAANIDEGSLLAIEEGGNVITTDLVLSRNGNLGPSATLRVRGTGSTLQVTDEASIGRIRGGVLQVLEGGRALLSNAAVGESPAGFPGNGSMLVDGDGSSVTVSERLAIGTQGQGTVTLANRGLLMAQVVYLGGTPPTGGSDMPEGTLSIGAGVGEGIQGAGLLDINDDINIAQTGKLVFNHTDAAYDFATKVESIAFGAGRIEQRAGTTVFSTNQDRYTGTVHVMGGTLIVNGILGTPTVEVYAGATLGGSGFINNVLAHDGATITPGNSPGVLTIDGDLTLEAGARLVLEIAGDVPGSEFDVLNIGGDAKLAGGLIELAFLGGFAPTVDQQFDVLNVTGLFNGLPAVQITGLEDGWLYDLTFNPTLGRLVLTSLNDGVSTSPVPVPPLLPVFLASSALVVRRRRR